MVKNIDYIFDFSNSIFEIKKKTLEISTGKGFTSKMAVKLIKIP